MFRHNQHHHKPFEETHCVKLEFLQCVRYYHLRWKRGIASFALKILFSSYGQLLLSNPCPVVSEAGINHSDTIMSTGGITS